jgi:hypothetical protein
MTGSITDDMAEKFVQTSGYINQIVTHVEGLLNRSRPKLAVCIEQLCNGTKESVNIRIHLSKITGLPTDFVKGLPDTIMIRYELATSESIADTDVANATVTIYVDPRYSIDDVIDAATERLPHELRHLVDANDASMLYTMIKTLDSNSSGDRAAYASDTGEYNARMSAVLSVALRRLADPKIRSKVHSADELVENIRFTQQFEDLMQDFDDEQYMAVRQNLVKILQNVMRKMN